MTHPAETRYVQLIKIVHVNPDTLDDFTHFAWRTHATDDEAWTLAHQVWRTWMERNPGVLTRLSVGRRHERHDYLDRHR